jgi:CRP-like cAMP-binding protein
MPLYQGVLRDLTDVWPNPFRWVIEQIRFPFSQLMLPEPLWRSGEEIVVTVAGHRNMEDWKETGVMHEKKFKAGDIIIAEGTHGDETFLIQEGQVQICKETGKSRILIATLSKGEVFGEMYLFDDTGFRSASVVACTDVVVQVIPRHMMQQHLADTPPIVLSIMRTLSARLAQTSQENSILKFKSSGGLFSKLAKLLGA